ncbi:9b7baf95-0efd-4290-a909-d3a1adf89746 [Thermothielavioides terrestris]|uniref:9b7baf95-0efd-4290-a909-d3a1adf89746 n=1 Tax=Thermothielavioides terrestris TaxID=2587410 RepID=A0A3S4ATM6_9PEZI|nr:9b7baf95-0efd-4290-a909-d3a1adf89746 [Thermothielavioides terrestris]
MDLTSHVSHNPVFLALPAELVERVACFLLEQDLLNFRRTCRRFHHNSQTAFANTFFSTVTTDLCLASFQRLQRIAQDDLPRHYVRTVIFTSKAPCPNRPRHAPGQGYHWSRTPGPQFQAQYLNPDVTSNPSISDFCTTLAAPSNLRLFPRSL